MSCFGVASALDGGRQSVVTYGTRLGREKLVPQPASKPSRKLPSARLLIHTTASMSIEFSGAKDLRHRYVPRNANAPPVPPKSSDSSTTRGRGHARPQSARLQKPLPLYPPLYGKRSKGDESLHKPLPQPPFGSSFKNILLWVGGFCVWFIIIVLLLPVILEEDAMPGLNRWLRSFWHRG
jgi:hypothetical protein